MNKGGRPQTGIGKQVVVRIQPDLLAALDAFIAENPRPNGKPYTRPDAVRVLIRDKLMGLGLMDHTIRPE